jgi:hypothetical protein
MKPLMTPDARLALAQAGFSRRRFLKGTGALIVAFRVGDMFELAESAFAQGFNGTGSPQLDAWLAMTQTSESQAARRGCSPRGQRGENPERSQFASRESCPCPD